MGDLTSDQTPPRKIPLGQHALTSAATRRFPGAGIAVKQRHGWRQGTNPVLELGKLLAAHGGPALGLFRPEFVQLLIRRPLAIDAAFLLVFDVAQKGLRAEAE
jgi:hypothetical protein